MPKIRTPLAALTMLLALGGLPGLARAGPQDSLDRALRAGRDAGQSQRVILRAKPGSSASLRLHGG